MTLEHTGLTEDDLDAVRDRSLVHNYDCHDIGEEYLVHRLERAGYHVEPLGDDARHADEVFFGDGPDQRVHVDEAATEHLADIEIKTKRLEQGEGWFGRLNRRHYNEYVEHAEGQDQPVFIFFALIEEAEETHDGVDGPSIVREGFIEVTGEEIDGDVTDISEQVVAFDAEDIQVPDAGSDGLRVVEAEDIVGIHRGEVVDGIPAVKGNDVVCLDEKRMRSWMYLLDCLESSRKDT
jgi:hypothetical protein